MKICLIYPRTINLDFFPLGIGYIAGVLEEKGHEVYLFDATREDNFTDTLKGIRPGLIGISVTTPAAGLTNYFINNIKNILPHTPIVCGGIHPSVFKEQFLKEMGIDFVIYGEGENTISELCEKLQNPDGDISAIQGLIYRRNGSVYKNQPRALISDLDTIAFPARHKVNFKRYLCPPGVIRGVWLERSTNIMTSRGCYGECVYCSSNYLFERKIRRRSVDNVIKEIELLANNYNIDGLFIMDDTFLINKKWIFEFVEKLKTKKFKIKWTCYGRVDSVSEDMLKAIKEAGCIQVEFGVESCSNRILTEIKKGTNVDQIRNAFEIARKSKLRTLGNFMIGFPTETVEEIEETINISKAINPDFATCYYATPYPGSEFYEYSVKENLILERDFSKWYVRDSNIWKSDIPWDKLQYLRRKFLRNFRRKNIYFFIRNYRYLFKLLLLLLKNPYALYLALRDSLIRYRCIDDFLYSFMSYNNQKGAKK